MIYRIVIKSVCEMIGAIISNDSTLYPLITNRLDNNRLDHGHEYYHPILHSAAWVIKTVDSWWKKTLYVMSFLCIVCKIRFKVCFPVVHTENTITVQMDTK